MNHCGYRTGTYMHVAAEELAELTQVASKVQGLATVQQQPEKHLCIHRPVFSCEQEGNSPTSAIQTKSIIAFTLVKGLTMNLDFKTQTCSHCPRTGVCVCHQKRYLSGQCNCIVHCNGRETQDVSVAADFVHVSRCIESHATPAGALRYAEPASTVGISIRCQSVLHSTCTRNSGSIPDQGHRSAARMKTGDWHYPTVLTRRSAETVCVTTGPW